MAFRDADGVSVDRFYANWCQAIFETFRARVCMRRVVQYEMLPPTPPAQAVKQCLYAKMYATMEAKQDPEIAALLAPPPEPVSPKSRMKLHRNLSIRKLYRTADCSPLGGDYAQTVREV